MTKNAEKSKIRVSQIFVEYNIISNCQILIIGVCYIRKIFKKKYILQAEYPVLRTWELIQVHIWCTWMASFSSVLVL